MGLFSSILKKLGHEKRDIVLQGDGLTMTPRAEVNDYFVTHAVTFSEKLRPGEKVNLEWQYKDGIMSNDMIEDILGSCNCTADITWGVVGVRAVFTHMETNVAKGGQVFTKAMTVYFRDGYGKVPNGRGGMKWDDRKKTRQLTFSGTLLPE